LANAGFAGPSLVAVFAAALLLLCCRFSAVCAATAENETFEPLILSDLAFSADF
jgi:hypothetical protein